MTILRFLSLIALFTLLSASACKKEMPPTVIYGKVVDKKTGAGLSGASLAMQIKVDPSHYRFDYIKSEQDGSFYFESLQNVGIFQVDADQYISKIVPEIPIEQGKENSVTIPMVPRDGFLKIFITDTSVQTDSLFVSIYSPTYDEEILPSYGLVWDNKVINLSPSGITSVKLTHGIASDENIVVYWNTQKMSRPPNPSTSAFGSVYVVANDTTTFMLDL